MASRRAELVRSTAEMVADRLPDNAASLQGRKLYKPVGVPAADGRVLVRTLSYESELRIPRHLELVPFPVWQLVLPILQRMLTLRSQPGFQFWLPS